ncbi:MAG: hypothetical protein JW867_03500 [Candidatus Omnitrophica bacterium]|nr:hypothetical protein [Candidatus Omnitrophota bacterium]
MKSNKNLSQQLIQLQQDVRNLTSVFNDERQIYQMQRKVEKLEQHLLKKIPESFSIPELNDMLTKPSKQFNFDVVSLSFGSQEEVEFNSSSGKATYNYVPINLSIDIVMDRLVEYLYWIKNQNYLVTLGNLSIQADPEIPGIVKATMLVKAYSYLPQGSGSIIDTPSTQFNEDYLKNSLNMPEEKTLDLTKYRRNQIFPLVQKAIEPEIQQQQQEKQEQKTSQNLKLQGIVIKNPKNLSVVVINGELLRQGDTILGYTIVDINPKKVTLENNAKSFELKIDNSSYRR